jgi:DNA-binding FadR family transcriptional regulator
MTSALHPLGGRQLLHQQVQDELKRYIVENRLKPGDQLPAEMDLARQLGVGRNTVREAVKSLEALGILSVRAGSGVSVRDSTLDVLNSLTYAMQVDFRLYTDVREVRQYLEQALVEPVIERVTDGQIERMRRTLTDWRAVARSGTYSVDHERAFHSTFWENLNNRFLAKILEMFWDTQTLMLASGMVTGPANPLYHHSLHRGILEALEARDAERLRSVLTDHYLDVLKRLEKSQRKRQAAGHAAERAASEPRRARPERLASQVGITPALTPVGAKRKRPARSA